MTRQDILIRAVEPDDYEAMQDIHAQPKVIWGTMRIPFHSVEYWRKRLADFPASGHSLVAEIDGRVVGAAGLMVDSHNPRRRHVGEVGMAVHDDFQGQGIGRKLLEACLELADQWLNLRRVELEVYTDNDVAILLYQSCGFEIEGTLRDDVFRDGEFVDAHVMSRIKV